MSRTTNSSGKKPSRAELLGRLSSIGAEQSPDVDVFDKMSSGSGATRRLDGAMYIDLALVEHNPYQVRTDYETGMEELVADVKQRGILQPIIVREIAPNRYQVVAGERRYRAAERAGLEEIPAIVRGMTDNDARIVTLIENVQRENLSREDERAFYQELQNSYNLSIGDIATLINKSRPYVSGVLNEYSRPTSALQQPLLQRYGVEVEADADGVVSDPDSDENHETSRDDELLDVSQYKYEGTPIVRGASDTTPVLRRRRIDKGSFRRFGQVLSDALVFMADESDALVDTDMVQWLEEQLNQYEAVIVQMKRILENRAKSS